MYVVMEGKASQRIVKTGEKKNGYMEILSGVETGETLVLDGAAYLTDGAPVNIQEKR